MYKLLAVLCLAAPAFCTVFQKCDSEPSALAVQVGDCVDDCEFSLYNNVSHYITFSPDHEVTSLTAVLKNASTTLLTDASACDSLTTGSCPLSAGDVAVYNYYVYTSDALLGPLEISFDLLDQNSKPVGCYKLDVMVVE